MMSDLSDDDLRRMLAPPDSSAPSSNAPADAILSRVRGLVAARDVSELLLDKLWAALLELLSPILTAAAQLDDDDDATASGALAVKEARDGE